MLDIWNWMLVILTTLFPFLWKNKEIHIAGIQLAIIVPHECYTMIMNLYLVRCGFLQKCLNHLHEKL